MFWQHATLPPGENFGQDGIAHVVSNKVSSFDSQLTPELQSDFSLVVKRVDKPLEIYNRIFTQAEDYSHH